MLHRTISWTRIGRAGLDGRPKIPTGLPAARVLAQGFARFRNCPLFTAGRFDRSAIVAAAAYAADSLQENRGLSRREAMSTSLKAAWQAAKMARSAIAH